MKRFITLLAVVCMYVCMYVCMITTLAHTKAAFADLKDGLVAYYPLNGNANASDEKLSDDFNDNTINSLWWTSDIVGTGPTIVETNQRLEITLPSSSSDDPSSESFSAGYGSTWTLRGDFDIQIDYQLLVWPSTNGVRVGLGLKKYAYAVERVSFGSSSDFPSYPDEVYTTDFNGSFYIISTSDTSGKLRLVRSNSTLTAYYYNSSSDNWVSIDSGSVTTADVGVSFASWSHNYAFMDKEVKVAFDNFLVNQGQLVGLISTPTATPTATLVQTPTPTPTVTETVTPTPTPPETGIVFGYVYDEDEYPLRTVTVKIDGDDYSDSSTTDEDGYYEFNKVPAGDYTITYTKTGYVTQTAETTVVDGDKVELDTVTMQVAQKGSIYGYVTNIRGDPIESVRLTFNGIGIKVKKTASTDSDGFFEFKDLEAGIYRIVAKKRFYKAAQQTVELEEGEDKEIEIEMKKTTKRIKMEDVLD